VTKWTSVRHTFGRVLTVLPFVLIAACAFATARPAGGNVLTQSTPDRAGTVWLCRPGQQPDPCTASLTTTVIGPNGSRHVVHYEDALNPPIDCFYLYPNITHQRATNANLDIDPQETAIAELEASPFSQVCRVFAPMYREGTGLVTGAAAATEAKVAYNSVLNAWNDYLEHYNDGRGIVLIGHSEGSYQLAQLLTQHVDQVPAVRKLLVSAIITGANLPVYKKGQGPLMTIGPCSSSTQTGCVMDFNAYSQSPPSNPMFGVYPQPSIDGHAVEDVCTNPANLAGGSGVLISMYRTQLPTQEVEGSVSHGIFGSSPPTSMTPWIEYDGLYSANCVTRNGAHVLKVVTDPGAPTLHPNPDSSWGLHLDDPNLAMGNLVNLVRTQAEVYTSSQHSSATG
jgi:Protein of unknown function (DUF3089)